MTALLFFSVALFSSSSPLWLFLAVLFHESGHILYGLCRKMGFPRIKLLPAGLRLIYPTGVSYTDSFFLALSGPFFSIIAFFLFRGTSFSLYSLGLGLINLVPVSYLDGGEMLASIVERFFLPDRAFLICKGVSVFFVIALSLFNILIQMKIGFNVSLIALTLYSLVTVLSESA